MRAAAHEDSVLRLQYLTDLSSIKSLVLERRHGYLSRDPCSGQLKCEQIDSRILTGMRMAKNDAQ